MNRASPRRWAFGFLIWLLVAFRLEAAVSGELIEIAVTGPREARMNVVILAEGYRSTERDRFLRDARVVAEGILQTPPLQQYAASFNVVGIFVPSQESGSDHPFRGTFRDTYFSSSFDSFGIQRLLTIPPNNHDPNSANGQGRVLELLADVYPEYDLVAIVVNDPEYGGSGGPALVVSNHSSSREIAVHELGHTLARLGDEYSTANPGYPDIEEPNTTRTTIRSQIKWNAWIEPSTPVPTPPSGFESQVGLFEGAHYQAIGWYRPKFNCKMRALGVPFCEVCSEALVLSIHEQLPQPAAVSPSSARPVSVSIYEHETFALELLPVAHQSASVSWSLNGVPLAPTATDLTLRLPGVGLPLATNVLTANLVLTTPLVRNDPFRRLQSSTFWTLVKDQLTPPRVQAELSTDSLSLQFSWSALAAGFALETSSSATSGSWAAVAEPAKKQDDRYRLLLPIAGDRAFYRLRRQ